jgi:hypothetical protein
MLVPTTVPWMVACSPAGAALGTAAASQAAVVGDSTTWIVGALSVVVDVGSESDPESPHADTAASASSRATTWSLDPKWAI